MRVFYGWWIVLAAFLNLFFAVGIIYYGFPVFYPSLVDSLRFTRAQLTQGFFTRIRSGRSAVRVACGCSHRSAEPTSRDADRYSVCGITEILMGSMTRLWQYYLLCIVEVFGYVLTGPIPNQVLISNWFRLKRGRAMGSAYLGSGRRDFTAFDRRSNSQLRFGDTHLKSSEPLSWWCFPQSPSGSPDQPRTN